MKNHYLNSSIITIIAVLFVLFIAAGCSVLLEKQYQNKEQPDAERMAPQTYSSQEECEQATGKSCGIAMCDVIPEGKTFEEVCGKGFRSGWQPMEENADVDTSIWQTYRNEQYGFEVKYPAGMVYSENENRGDYLLITSFAYNDKPLFTISIQKTTFSDVKDWFLDFKQKTESYVASSWCQITSSEDFSLGNYTGKKWRIDNKNCPLGDSFVVSIKNNNSYLFLYNGWVPTNEAEFDRDYYRSVFNQILSTFKFISLNSSSITPANILNKEFPQLTQSTVLVNKYFVEFDNAKTYTIWLYVKEKPTTAQIENFVRIIANKLTDLLSGYFFNFYIFPANSTKIPGDTQLYDNYVNVLWRNGQVVFPLND